MLSPLRAVSRPVHDEDPEQSGRWSVATALPMLLPYLNSVRHGLLLIDAHRRGILASGQTLRLLGRQKEPILEGSSVRHVLRAVRDSSGDNWGHVRAQLQHSFAQHTATTFEISL